MPLALGDSSGDNVAKDITRVIRSLRHSRVDLEYAPHLMPGGGGFRHSYLMMTHDERMGEISAPETQALQSARKNRSNEHGCQSRHRRREDL
jgi:hypothetical protein